MLRNLRPFSSPVGLFLLLLLTGLAGAAVPAARPNVVVLLADDLGYGELGCQGNPEIPTPHIDSLARDGVRFTDGYVTAAFCSASRAGLLTGRYQGRFGYEFNPVGAHNEDPGAGLPPSEQTLADVLRDAGYATAIVGKWHLGGTARYFPLRRGFDSFFGFLHEGHFFVPPPYDGVTTMLRRRALPGGGKGRWISADGRLVLSTHMGHNEPAYDADNPVYRGGQPVDVPTYLTDALTREAVDFIGRSRREGRPFFLYLAYNAVHSPLQGADTYMRRFDGIPDIHRRIFAAMLSNLDDSVGAVLNKIHEEGLDEETLVFFLSDNGGPTRELTSSNAPLRGEKGQLFEGGIRVPFLARWPGVIPPALRYEHPVVALDIFATAAAVSGAEPKPGVQRDGVDLLPYLTGATDTNTRPHDVLFWRTGDRSAVRAGDWKALRNPSGRGDGRWQLYHLAEDIGETVNRSAEEPTRLRDLVTRWEALDEEMVAPVWRPRKR